MGIVYDEVDGVPGEVWREPAVGSVLERPEWLASSRWPGDGVGYLVEGRTLLPLRTVTEPHAWPSMNLVDVCAGEAFGLQADQARVARARRASVPHLIVAAPGYHTVPIGDRDPGALDDLVDAVAKLAAAAGMPFGYAHVPPEGEDLLRVLRGRGFHVATASAMARLDLPGRTFDDYLASLGTKGRNRVRRERRRFAAAGGVIRVARGDEVAPWLPLIAKLEAELHRSHGFDAEPASYLEVNARLLRRFGQRMHVLRADLAGRPVATVTLFAGSREIVSRSLGIRQDPAVRAAFVYFNVNYYAAIDLAYRLGVGRVVLGTRAWEAKTDRGARLVPLRAALPPESPEPLRTLLGQTGASLDRALAGLQPADGS